MDSFINVATFEKNMTMNGMYSQPQLLATLNEVSGSLSSLDLFSKFSMKEEQESQAFVNQMVIITVLRFSFFEKNWWSPVNRRIF